MTDVAWRLDAADSLIRQHVVAGRVVVPMAFWLSRCLQDVTALAVETPCQLVRVLVRRPVVLEEGVALDVRFVVPEAGAGRFEVRSEGASPGRALVEGAWLRDEGGEWRKPRPCREPTLSRDGFYAAAERAGLSYGEGLRRVDSLSRGDRAWTCELRPVEERGNRVAGWDAMLQSGAVLAAEEDGNRWLPFGVDRIRLGEGEPGEPIGRVYGEWTGLSTTGGERVRIANLLGFGARSGAVLVELSGVRYGTADAASEETGEAPRAEAEAPVVPAGPQEILGRLRSEAPGERRALLTRFIEDQLLEVLQWNESKRANLAAGFVAIGVDSLMSVDLQYRLQTALDFALPLGESLEATSVPDLANSLLEKYLELD